MTFRDNHIRVEPRAGRLHVQIQQGDGEWQTLAIREHQEVAMALCAALRQTVSEHTDEGFEAARAIQRAEAASEEAPSLEPGPKACRSCGEPWEGFGVVCATCRPEPVTITETPAVFDVEGT